MHNGKLNAGPLTLDRLLDVLLNASLLEPEQAADVRVKSSHKTRRIRREREQAGDSDKHVTPIQLVSAFNLPVRDGPLSEERISRAVAVAAKIPFVAIDPLRVDAKLVTDTVSYAYARRNAVLPLSLADGRLTLAVDDPWATDVAATMQAHVEAPVELVMAKRSAIVQMLDEVFRFRGAVKGAVAELGGAGTDLGNLEQLVQIGSTGNSLESDDSHVVQAVDFLLRYALDQGASDLHLEPKRGHALVRLWIDGVLHPVQELPKVVHNAVTSRIKTLARLDIAEKRRPQDGRIKLGHRKDEVELRISTMPTAFGEKIVIRFFDPGVLLQDLDGLGLFATELEQVRTFIRRPNGLILVTGPTGSGKTTTLYSALRAVASPTVNVTTIEDPIEMVVEAFNQCAVNKRLGLTFGSLLRTLLRQDPDVIMVGEIRDEETAKNAIQAALTGHLVLATVHTNDAPSSVSRMLDLGAEPFLLATTLVGVIGQRLLRKVCLNCRYELELSPDQATALGLELGRDDQFMVWRGKGCSTCRNTGLKGRIGIFEVMPSDEKIRRLIQDSTDAGEIGRQATRDGMLTLRQAAIKKMALGMTSFEEVMRVTAESHT